MREDEGVPGWQGVITAKRPTQQITVRIAGHDHVAAGPISDDATKIIDALAITPQ